MKKIRINKHWWIGFHSTYWRLVHEINPNHSTIRQYPYSIFQYIRRRRAFHLHRIALRSR
jgi:hypothetical protein